MSKTFTGERFEPDLQGEIRLEHYHRYALAIDLVRNKTVLDLACGDGYGSFLLSKHAVSVLGVDISSDVILNAQNKYANQTKNLQFQQGSASKLTLQDSFFDVVVSYETIEHLYEQSEMLEEIHRVLKPDGILIISSPNKPVYSKNGDYQNHFHVKELDFAELDELLKKQFKAIEYYGQRLQIGSIINSVDRNMDYFKAWSDDGEAIKPETVKLLQPVYYIAVCAANAKFLPEVSPSVFYPNELDLLAQYQGYAVWAKSTDIAIDEARSIIQAKEEEHQKIASWAKDLELELKTSQKCYEDLVLEHEKTAHWGKDLIIELDEARSIIQAKEEEHQKIASWAKDLDGRLNSVIGSLALSNHRLLAGNEKIQFLEDLVAKKSGDIVGLQSLIAQRDQQIAELDLEIIKRGEWAVGLIGDLNRKQEELNQVLRSHSWRITKPMRVVRRWFSSPTKQTKRYASFCLTLLKQWYQRLPFSHVTRNKHKAFISRAFPWMLRLSKTSHNFIYPRSAKTRLTLHSRAMEINFCLPTSSDPIVSIIIPIYGKVEFTLACLRSIATFPPNIPFEVLVIDDCSPDNSAQILAQIEGLQLYSNKENQGFIKSCNSGARISKGKYIYFLNNDTEVTDGWLDSLYHTFSDLPGTGLVGSKLIYPDGTLQEAGCIIWRDGSAWNFGRNQDASLPIFNYAREVDYCSGASIMVPRNIFDDMGGFDELYTPAYCEDSDLALKIRESGYRVIYQPESVVVHFEGVSSGTDTAQGIKAHQIENSKKLYERWKGRLQSHQINGMYVDDAKDRIFTKRVLVLDHCTPTPDQDAGSVTAVNTLILLRELGYQVTFIAEDNFLYMPSETAALQKIGVEVLYAPFVRSVREHVEEFGSRYDLVFLFRPIVVERNIEIVRKYCQKAKVLFHTVDLHFLRMSREADLRSDDLMQASAEEMKERELLAISQVDATIVHSTAELEILRTLAPDAKLYVFPLILDIKGTLEEFKNRRNILFVGGFQHAPNVDAVHFFSEEIMPILRKKIPGVRFLVAGSKPPSDILQLSSDDVIIMGYVEDLDALLDKVRISVAPLRYGAGIKGKVGTAMAAGVPVVGTKLAAEGMLLSDGENILLGDSPEDFAAKICELYANEELWKKLSSNGINFAEEAWGAISAMRILSKIVGDCGLPTSTHKYQLQLYSSGK
jgi:GT2 family glycosyltransferase/ubiquinone/menaquinone biosynthesis C-methylase UbiE/glycosyltransferase involved in cell wall biosynthesis